MRLLKTFGPLMEFSNRDAVPKVRKGDDLFEWKKFISKSQRHSVKLKEKQPDIVERINEKNREEKERDRQKKEDTKNGEWHYNGEMDEYYWTGENEPEYFDDNFMYEAPTEEDRKIAKEAEERWIEAMIEEDKRVKKERRQKKERERREAMAKPIDPLPVSEMCQYEKIRESIIKEREEAMAKYEFYEDLMQTKKEIGLYKEASKNSEEFRDAKAKHGDKKID
jgi:hypothetical protein